MGSPSRYSVRVLLALSGERDVTARSEKIGPSPVFEWPWEELDMVKNVKGPQGFPCGPSVVSVRNRWLLINRNAEGPIENLFLKIPDFLDYT